METALSILLILYIYKDEWKLFLHFEMKAGKQNLKRLILKRKTKI